MWPRPEQPKYPSHIQYPNIQWDPGSRDGHQTLKPPQTIALEDTTERRRAKPSYEPSPEQRRTKPGSEPSTRHRNSGFTCYRQPQERVRTERSRTPHYREISNSESSTFSSRSLGSDLRHMIGRLQGYKDTRRRCHRCGLQPHRREEDCSALPKICRFCKCTNHIRAMCPKFSAPGYLREADKLARGQDDQTEKATDQKRERSASAINDKPRKP